MAQRAATLAERFGQVQAQATFVQAAIVAAHGAFGARGGFRASDVRFFFLLFTNWVEHDVLRPEQDLDLTQVRRALARLARMGWLHREVREGGAGGKARYTLTGAGIVGLIEGLVDPGARRPFEEVLFVVTFVVSYRGAILARVRSPGGEVGRAQVRRIEELLDPRRVVRAAKEVLGTMLRDLEKRAAASRVLEDEAARWRSEGATPAQMARRLEGVDPYQLQRVRPFGEVLTALPEDLLDFEVGDGITLRRRVLFEPLAAQARAWLSQLERIEAIL